MATQGWPLALLLAVVFSAGTTFLAVVIAEAVGGQTPTTIRLKRALHMGADSAAPAERVWVCAIAVVMIAFIEYIAVGYVLETWRVGEVASSLLMAAHLVFTVGFVVALAATYRAQRTR